MSFGLAFVSEEGIQVRGFVRTVKVRWADVRHIRLATLNPPAWPWVPVPSGNEAIWIDRSDGPSIETLVNTRARSSWGAAAHSSGHSAPSSGNSRSGKEERVDRRLDRWDVGGSPLAQIPALGARTEAEGGSHIVQPGPQLSPCVNRRGTRSSYPTGTLGVQEKRPCPERLRRSRRSPWPERPFWSE